MKPRDREERKAKGTMSIPSGKARPAILLGALTLLLMACAGTGGAGGGGAKTPTARAADLPEGAPREELPWATFSPETFAKAKAERKYILVDCSAEWCHWCHVMEAVTYHDPGVRKILDQHFIAVKVDIDSRPDLEERYGDYGWPATVILSPDAMELGKYRGYIDPEKFQSILNDVVASGAANQSGGAEPARGTTYKIGVSRKNPRRALAEETLDWIERSTEAELDDYYDTDEGGWGRTQKAPLGWDNAWMLWKAEHAEGLAKEEAKKKIFFTLEKQSKLIDPVWGGIYQYSAAKDWDHAHFEKLMTFQAPALENYSVAYRLTGEPKHLARANAMRSYLDRFMRSPEGGFYTSQDADLNAHDRQKPFMDGHAYYALGEEERLAKGLPRIDTHEYGRENGLAIGAYVAYYEATKDAEALAAAEKAARRILATHAMPNGGITHDKLDPEKPPKQLFLSDNAAFGWGLMRLYEVTKKAEWLERAKAIADFMLTELVDDDGGGLFGATKDPDAVGVFATRRVPFEENVMALRMFARLARASLDVKYKVAIDRVLRAISTPEEIKARGRMLGDYLLALEETKGVRGVAK